jgi:uncharacterized protein YmfQ (DUF2313 family)
MALLDLLPESYSKSPEVTNLQESFDYCVSELVRAKAELFDQLFANTATYGLTAWEKALGIETNISESYEFRRERIQAKLRGAGTTTKSMIKHVATSYSNGEVEVIEDQANHSFKVKFIGTKGIPPKIDDLTLTIEEIKPAHLSFKFEYTYNTWNDVSAITWDEASMVTWDQLKTR